MALIDIILLLLGLVICISAAVKGFIDEVFGLGALIISSWAAFMFMNKLQPYFAAIMNDNVASVITFLILFIIVFLVMKIIQTLLKSVFSAAIFQSLDHGLGFLFGIAEGILFIVIVFIVMEILQTWVDSYEIRAHSYLYHLFQGMIDSAGFKLTETLNV